MTTFEQQYKNLNTEQKKAVDTIYGPVMVLAGPGTGKTQILALRIANILNKTDSLPENILCLTFTEAGAKAMRERLKSFIESDAYKVGIFTFHGFANTVIQEFPEYFAFSKDLNQLDDVTRLKVIRESIEETGELDKLRPFYNKFAKERDIISAIQTLKQEGLNPEELRVKSEKLKVEHEENPKLNKKGEPTVDWKNRLQKLETINELVKVYKTYQNKLLENGFYDYEDMILFVGDKLKEEEKLRSYYQEKYQFIHVDEYQDTNGGQNEILHQLTKDIEKPDVFVVGDDDQAIYRFQGANLENILSFNVEYSDVTTIPITTNYRSTQNILDLAGSVIKNNVQRLSNRIESLEKVLKAHFSDNSDKAELHELETIEDEYIFISKEIEKLIAQGNNPKDIAIIYRKNAHGLEINKVLNQHDITTNHASSNNILNSETILQLINIFKIISLFEKNINADLYRTMLYPYFGIPVVDVYELVQDCRKEGISLIEKILSFEEKEEEQKGIENFSSQLKMWHKESVSKTLSELFLSIINDSGLLDYVSKNHEVDTEFNDLLALISFHEFIKSVERVNRKITLEEFLKDIELMSENNYVVTSSKIENENGVNLLTAHSSKGLEFKYVFIIHATENNWGSTRKMPSLLVPEIYNEYYDAEEDAASRLEDERRLFFVAMTRAKEKLYFTKAKTEINDGSVSNLSTSQFVEELDQNNLEFYKPEDHDIKDSDLLTLLKKPEIESYSIEEEKFLRERIKNFALSATALNDYIESPILFKERHLIRIPQAKQKNAVMGTAVHEAMEFLNRALIKDSDLSKIKFESLDNVYRATLKREFEGDEEYEATLEEGSSILKKYFDYYIATNKYEIPVEAEYNFGFHNVMLQLAEGDEIKLSGKIDKVEMIDKDSNSVRIVDYKTSKPHSENHIKGNTKQSDGRYWRQLVFYKILCEADQNFRPKDKFNSLKYACDEVQIDYLKDEKGKFVKRTFSVTDEDVSKLKEVIKDVMEHIRNLEFPEENIIKIR